MEFHLDEDMLGVVERPESDVAYSDRQWMEQALVAARRAEAAGEVPIGAVIVRDGERLAEGHNSPIGSCDPSAHAEIVAMRAAGRRVGNYRLTGTTLYVTVEPCLMCLGAMIHARIDRLVYGASDPKVGAASMVEELADRAALNHRIRVEGGLLADEAGSLLRGFFAKKRSGEVPKWS